MELIQLKNEDQKDFKKYMQESFQYGYETVYGKDKSQVLPEDDIDKSLNNPKCHAYEMIDNNSQILGGAIVEINDDNINHLDFLFVRVGIQNKGIGQVIWEEIENIYSDTKIWKTCTPYFDKRNIHFYVNKLKFKIVEYYNEKYPDPNMPDDIYKDENGMFDGMFGFEKDMNNS